MSSAGGYVSDKRRLLKWLAYAENKTIDKIRLLEEFCVLQSKRIFDFVSLYHHYLIVKAYLSKIL